MDSYSRTLRELREAAGISQRTLAKAIGLSHTLLNRSETGSRPPSGPEEVERIASTLGLAADAHDRLLAAAGYWPHPLIALGPGDPTLRALAMALIREDLPAPARAALRRAVEATIEAVIAASKPETPINQTTSDR